MQIVAKALISAVTSVVIAIAASTPLGAAGVAAQAATYARATCALLAGAAAEELLSGSPLSTRVFSPTPMNITAVGFVMKCASGNATYSISLPAASAPFQSTFTGTANFTVTNDNGTLEW
ncbi:MAG TPA: hypothetical protein VMS77_07020 [Conexivisphaerales archaeon]|nr:hypothetical protein [Conexivisphaerales archaeon]